jgi:DNA-binding NtrC family response regulator
MALILLVEDYPSLQAIYQETLGLANHTVHVAANADDALKLVEQHTYDIILLDLLLRKSWGLDFLTSFDVKKHPQTNIIIMSNLFSVELMNKSLALGAAHYLIKSEVTPKRLTEIVQTTLEEAKKPPTKDKKE